MEGILTNLVDLSAYESEKAAKEELEWALNELHSLVCDSEPGLPKNVSKLIPYLKRKSELRLPHNSETSSHGIEKR